MHVQSADPQRKTQKEIIFINATNQESKVEVPARYLTPPSQATLAPVSLPPAEETMVVIVVCCCRCRSLPSVYPQTPLLHKELAALSPLSL